MSEHPGSARAAARRAVPALRRGSLPKSALTVGIGLGILGASTYGFLLLSARQVSAQAFAGLSVLYVLVYTVAPGVFLPFEQEIGRALADRRTRRVATGPLVRSATRVSAVVIGALLIVVGAACPFMVNRLFNGSWWLCLGLLLSVAGEGAAYVTRGIFAGNDQFGAYGLQLGLEGAVRFVLCVVLVLTGIHAVGPYGVLLGGAFLVAVLGTAPAIWRRSPLVPGEPASAPGPELGRREFTTALGWLICGSLLAQGLVNFGPVAVKVLSPTQSAAAGDLLAGLVLARLPLFLFAAVQAALLPGMSAALARGRPDEFRSGLRKLLLALAALATAMLVVLAVAGPSLVSLVFGRQGQLGRLDLVVLSAATGLFMVANVVANGLLALQRFGLAVLGWAVGAVVLAGVLALPGALIPRVEYSFLGGTIASVLAFAVLLRSALRAGPVADRHARPVLDVVSGL